MGREPYYLGRKHTTAGWFGVIYVILHEKEPSTRYEEDIPAGRGAAGRAARHGGPWSHDA